MSCEHKKWKLALSAHGTKVVAECLECRVEGEIQGMTQELDKDGVLVEHKITNIKWGKLNEYICDGRFYGKFMDVK